jgi:hypothetical protein
MNIYLASKYESKHMLNLLADLLEKSIDELRILSRWHRIYEPMDLESRSRIDKEDLDSTDLLIAVAPVGFGANAEIGYYLGAGKPVVYYVDQTFSDGLVKISNGDPEPLLTGLFRPVSTLWQSDSPCIGYIANTFDHLKYVIEYIDFKNKN